MNSALVDRGLKERIAADPSLGQRITEALARAGLTKSDLQRALGVRWATVHDWTRDKSTPTAENLKQIAEVTGVEIAELLGVAEGQDPPFDSWSAFLRTPEGQNLSAGERRALQGIPWPPGTEPTISSYLVALSAVRSVVPRS